MTSSLVGSEMCIRDRKNVCPDEHGHRQRLADRTGAGGGGGGRCTSKCVCLLYTSDAADDM
eukprot:12040649-Prorocentrum_lima.AAC.1